MTTNTFLLPSEEKVLSLLSMITSCEQYGYDNSSLHYLATSGLVRTDHPSFFGLETFSGETVDKDTVLQSAMEQVAAVNGAHDAKMEKVHEDIEADIADISKRLDSPANKDKKIPVSAISAVLGALIGVKQLVSAARANGVNPKDAGGRIYMKQLFESRREILGKLAAAKTVVGAANETLLPVKISKLKSQLHEVESSLQQYRHGSNSAAALWKSATGPKKAVIAAVAIAGNAFVFWVLSKIILAGLRWVKSKLHD